MGRFLGRIVLARSRGSKQAIYLRDDRVVNDPHLEEVGEFLKIRRAQLTPRLDASSRAWVGRGWDLICHDYRRLLPLAVYYRFVWPVVSENHKERTCWRRKPV